MARLPFPKNKKRPLNVTSWTPVVVNATSGSNRKHIWQQVWVPNANEDERAWGTSVVGQIGAHFVVGRDRIRQRPVEFYKELLMYAVGQKWYPGAQYWFDNNLRKSSYGPGHQGSAAFWLEPLWHKVFSHPPGDIPNPSEDPVACKL